MERRQWDQRPQVFQDFWCDDSGRRILCPTVNDTMSDSEYLRALKTGPKPYRQALESRARISHGRAQLPILERPACAILGRESWGRADALDLTPRLEAPRLTVAGQVHTELQARRPGIENEHNGVSIHEDRPQLVLKNRRLRNSLKRLSSSVCRKHSNRAAGDPGANRIGSPCQDDRNICAQNETGAVGVRQEAELLGEHVARLEVRNQEDVGIAGDLGHNALYLGGLCANGVVERQWTVEDAARDLLPFCHLAEAGGVDGGLHLGIDGLDRRQNGDLRSLHAESHRQVDRVLADVDLGLEVWRAVDRGIGDD